MNSQVLVWDLETIPDLSCVSRVHNLSPEDETAAREVLGDKFPKLPFCKIVCVGALRAERTEFGYQVRSLGAPHSGERSEPELIQTFAEKIHELQPKLVTYNGGSFDLPVLRYRAMTIGSRRRAWSAEGIGTDILTIASIYATPSPAIRQARR